MEEIKRKLWETQDNILLDRDINEIIRLVERELGRDKHEKGSTNRISKFPR